MATPRKNWFKVPDSICFDALTNDELACLVRLQAYMNTRWARDGKKASERGKCTIDARMAMTISGKHRPDVALTSLRHLADITSMSVRSEGNIVSIDWPKYAEFQAMDARESPLPSPISKPSPNQAKEEKKERAPAPRSCVCPDRLSDHDLGLASEWGAGKGFTSEQLAYAWDRVRDWSHSKQLKRTDWLATLRNAMTDGWALKGYGQNPTGEIESPAQARARRTKEAGAKAYEMIQARKQQLGLMEIEGGTR